MFVGMDPAMQLPPHTRSFLPQHAKPMGFQMTNPHPYAMDPRANNGSFVTNPSTSFINPMEHEQDHQQQQPRDTDPSANWFENPSALQSSETPMEPPAAFNSTPTTPTASANNAHSQALGEAPSNSRQSSPAKKVFVCQDANCGKQFPRAFALRRHMRIHTREKPYACDYEGCTQRFNTSGNLSRHKRIHTGDRPYKCNFFNCGKSFNTSTKLKRHMRVHYPNAPQAFRCVEQGCGWSGDNYKQFKLHQKVQHGNDEEPKVKQHGASTPTNTASTLVASPLLQESTNENAGLRGNQLQSSPPSTFDNSHHQDQQQHGMTGLYVQAQNQQQQQYEYSNPHAQSQAHAHPYDHTNYIEERRPQVKPLASYDTRRELSESIMMLHKDPNLKRDSLEHAPMYTEDNSWKHVHHPQQHHHPLHHQIQTEDASPTQEEVRHNSPVFATRNPAQAASMQAPTNYATPGYSAHPHQFTANHATAAHAAAPPALGSSPSHNNADPHQLRLLRPPPRSSHPTPPKYSQYGGNASATELSDDVIIMHAFLQDANLN